MLQDWPLLFFLPKFNYSFHSTLSQVSNQHTKYPALPDDFQTDSFSDLAAQASRKLIIGASENPTKMITPTFTGEGSKGKGVQVS